MSADNWRACPRCRLALVNAAEEAKVAEDKAYGAVAIDEFDRLRGETAAAMQRVVDFDNGKPSPTFREDYEFYGIEDGVLHVSYSGRCGRCDLKVLLKEDHPFSIGGAE